ncbi:YycH family regulatory protein [Paenibacillus sp. GCM10023250]|uniref:YycH family regulatory protein n=1 Tax=Paenibacillus sp. GCM10023250 TaxID=3252648 RepID=UPI00360F1408
MIDRAKTAILTVLVVVSLIQSYLLAYSMPGLGVTASPQQGYIPPVTMGEEEQVENVIFPEDMVLHLGKARHTVLYPASNFYNLIFEKIKSREFKGFQRAAVSAVDWNEVRDGDQGIELRFGRGVPMELLSKVLKLEGDAPFMNDVVDRIWIYAGSDGEEVRTYFFSADNMTVYESVKADLTAQDVQMYVGYGEYQVNYKRVGQDLYLPEGPVEASASVVGYDSYTPEQMQSYLFLDPGVTRTISDRNGSQIYTDGKRGLQIEQNGRWLSYTDPVAVQGQGDNESQNVYAAVQFVNSHGGWDGMHRFVHAGGPGGGQVLRFQQYYGSFPVIPMDPFLFGSMKLRLQEGDVSEYERSMLMLKKKPDKRSVRWLPGGDMLESALTGYARKADVAAIYPALLARPANDKTLTLDPVWAVRLGDDTQAVLLEAVPGGYKPLPGEPGGAPLEQPDGGGNASSGSGDSGAHGSGATGGGIAMGGLPPSLTGAW